MYLTDDEKKRAEEILAQHGVDLNKPVVGIHPGARKELKCWSPSGYATVADFIISERGGTVLLTGSPDEAKLAQRVADKMKQKAIILAGKTSIRELAAVISQCSLFIFNDSSPMHIAAATNTPTIAIFGPSKSIETAPYGKGNMVVEKDFPCRYTCDEDVCKYSIFNECMESITVNDVFKAVKELIEETGLVRKPDYVIQA